MKSKFMGFMRILQNHEIESPNQKLKGVVDDYTFLEISENDEIEINLKIIDNIKESKVIIINHYKEQGTGKNDFYFVVSFKRTILIIKETRINTLQALLSKKEKLEICFLSNTKKIFDAINIKMNETQIKYDEITNDDENFLDDIKTINNNFFRIKTKNFQYDVILQIIKTSISGYLLKQSYYTYDRISNYKDKIKSKEITKDEVIELRTIGIGSVSQSVLYYYIEYEKLVVIKKYSLFDPENDKLLKREIKNYEEINHPLIPKFYGTIQYDELSYPVIEFINGKTLKDTDFSQFSETEIYEIIFQILIVFFYLHAKHFIYRDLKPNNVMIDENKIISLIDMDRMIKDCYIYNEYKKTADFPSIFAAPEVNSKDMTNKCDIYSIGKLIEFIIIKNESIMKNNKNTKLFQMIK